MLIRIVKKWTYPDLLRQTPRCTGDWGDIHFTLEPVEECDALLVINELAEDLTVNCPPENVWAIFQEPYYPDFFPWMRNGHSRYSRVYTHCPPRLHERYHTAHPLVPWHVGRTYDELVNGEIQPKNDRIVWITSALQVLPGHFRRHAFYTYLTKLGWNDLDVRGRGIRPIEDKWDILALSRYSIAVENHFSNNYWTEKIADCWLANTLPFYYGCPNLESYFPEKSFVRIDLDDYESSADIIRRMVDSGEYEKRLPAIREARDLILNRYQFFPFMSKEIKDGFNKSSVSPVHLSAFREKPINELKNHCFQMFHLYRARNSK
jgi:hypothetical protein